MCGEQQMCQSELQAAAFKPGLGRRYLVGFALEICDDNWTMRLVRMIWSRLLMSTKRWLMVLVVLKVLP